MKACGGTGTQSAIAPTFKLFCAMINIVGGFEPDRRQPTQFTVSVAGVWLVKKLFDALQREG